MSEIQDSAAIIAADMRQLADDIEAGRAIVGQSVWRSYAGRVEAIGTGNIAKLREALKDIGRIVEQIRLLYSDYPYEIHVIARKASAALAEPARNCDRFASAEEAWDAYDEWVESYRSKGKTPPLNEFGWLFAPYEEGGAK